jgi:hypothetical protein
MNESYSVESLKQLEKRTDSIGNDIMRKIVNTSNQDARASTFFILSQLIRSLKIYFILKSEYLDNREWYIDIYLKKWEQQWPVIGGKYGVVMNDHELLNSDLHQVMLGGYIQLLYSVIESRFRIFTIVIDREACKQGTGNFNEVYHWLLGRLGKNEQPYENLLIFFGRIRNTIHNNGFYMNIDNPKPPPIIYHGRKYTFEHTKALDLKGGAYRLFILEITPDLITMM